MEVYDRLPPNLLSQDLNLQIILSKGPNDPLLNFLIEEENLTEGCEDAAILITGHTFELKELFIDFKIFFLKKK